EAFDAVLEYVLEEGIEPRVAGTGWGFRGGGFAGGAPQRCAGGTRRGSEKLATVHGRILSPPDLKSRFATRNAVGRPTQPIRRSRYCSPAKAGALGLQVVLLEQIVKRRPADAEQFGGARNVVVGPRQRLADRAAVGGLAGSAEGDRHRHFAARLGMAEVEVGGAD